VFQDGALDKQFRDGKCNLADDELENLRAIIIILQLEKPNAKKNRRGLAITFDCKITEKAVNI